MNHKYANSKPIKTYKPANKTYKIGGLVNKEDDLEDLEVPLTTHDAVKYLLQGTLRLRVCRYCLNVTSKLSEFDEILTLAVSGALHEVTVRDIVASFHPFKVADDPNFPNKICNVCVNRAISCYLFSQQCDRAERALRNCFDDIYEKFEKLDPIEPVKRRGKRKLNPNHNIIHAEHDNVIGYAEPVINIVNITNYIVEQSNDKMSELECQKCWQILPNVESLINHENSHPKSMWFSCRLCGKSFVKRSHLRKHIKETHTYIQDTAEDIKIDDFKCNECGSINKTLGEHLQHIEKHKFKLLFKCLVERKVDSMCTVCLDEGSRLMSLKDVVHLHGGYSGSTGDRSIEDILTATIPGPNQYKYDELLVPHQAKILRLKKRKLNQEEKDFVSPEINKKFVFDVPVLVQKIDFDFTSSITFTFSKPLFYNPDKDSNEQKVLKCTIDVNESDDEIGNDLSNAMYLEEEQITIASDDDIGNDLSNRMYREEENNTIAIPEITQDKTSCKICWIFKAQNCDNCLNNTSAVLKEEPYDKVKINIKDDCKFCWIFGKTGKCNNCNKHVVCNELISTETADILVNNFKKRTDKNTIEKVSAPAKELELWKCNVCLTTNSKNRFMCICCDRQNVSTDNSIKIFGNGNSFMSGVSNVINPGRDDNIRSEINVANETTKHVGFITNENLKLATEKEATTIPGVNEVFDGPVTYTKERRETRSSNTENSIFLPDAKENIKDNLQVINKESMKINSTNTENKLLPDNAEVSEDSKMDIETIQFNEKNLNYSMNTNYSTHIIEHNALDSNIEDMDVAFYNNPPSNSTAIFSSIKTAVDGNTSMGTNHNIFQPFTFNIGAGSKDQKNRHTKKPLRRIATTSYK